MRSRPQTYACGAPSPTRDELVPERADVRLHVAAAALPGPAAAATASARSGRTSARAPARETRRRREGLLRAARRAASHVVAREPAAMAARSMLRIGVTPVPVATMSEGDSLAGAGRVKKPCGPMNRRTAPGSTRVQPRRPGPPCTCVTAISNRGEPSGADAIEYDRFISGCAPAVAALDARRRIGAGARVRASVRVRPRGRAHPLPGNERHRLPVDPLEHELAHARRQRPRLGERGLRRSGAAVPSSLYLGLSPAAARPRATAGRLSRQRLRAVGVRRLHARESAEGALHAEQRVERVVRRACGSRAPPSARPGWPRSRGADGRSRRAGARRPSGSSVPTTRASKSCPAAASSSARDASSSAVDDDLGAAPHVDEHLARGAGVPARRLPRPLRWKRPRCARSSGPSHARSSGGSSASTSRPKRPRVTASHQKARLRSSNQGSSGAKAPVRASNAARISATAAAVAAAPAAELDDPRRCLEHSHSARAGVLCRDRARMENRIFFPQAALDEWIVDGTVELQDGELTILAVGRRYRLAEAVHVVRDVSGGGDDELVGRVEGAGLPRAARRRDRRDVDAPRRRRVRRGARVDRGSPSDCRSPTTRPRASRRSRRRARQGRGQAARAPGATKSCSRRSPSAAVLRHRTCDSP